MPGYFPRCSVVLPTLGLPVTSKLSPAIGVLFSKDERLLARIKALALRKVYHVGLAFHLGAAR